MELSRTVLEQILTYQCNYEKNNKVGVFIHNVKINNNFVLRNGLRQIVFYKTIDIFAH